MSLCLLLTELGPQRIVGVCLGQQIHALGRVLLQEDLDRWLPVGHDGGHPSQVVGQDGRQQRRQEPETDTQGWLASMDIQKEEDLKTFFIYNVNTFHPP